MNSKYIRWFLQIAIIPAALITYELMLSKFTREQEQPTIIVNNAIHLSSPFGSVGQSFPITEKNQNTKPLDHSTTSIDIDKHPLSLMEKNQDAKILYHSISSAGMWNVLANATHCAAFFRSEKGMVAIAGNKNSAILYLEGKNVPLSGEPILLPTVLHQTDTPPKAVRAMISNGGLSFAVPSLQAGMEGMLENHHFRVEMEGKTVMDISWENGVFVRHKLQECFKQMDTSV